MALAEETVTAADKRGFRSVLSHRPVVIFGSALAGLGSLAVLLTFGAEAKTADDQPVHLEPDFAGAQALHGEADKAHLDVPPEPPLTVQEPVQDLSLPESDVPAAVSPAAYTQRQQEAYEKFLLDAQQLMLASRLQGRTAGLRVESFVAAEKEQEEKVARSAQLLQQLSGGGGEGGGPPLSGLGELGPLAALGASPAIAALSGGGHGSGGLGGLLGGLGAGGMGGAGQTDPNFNGAKLDFFQRGGQQLEPGKLDGTVRPAYSPYELQMGAVIPGVLLSGISSEGPGQILGQVSENVYDSASGRFLLIPQGSKLVGTYSALVAQGQTRVQVAWVRLNFPNGNKLDLGGMSGTDQAGVTGFKDKVNRHWGARFMAALMTSAITVAYELTAPRSGNVFEGAVRRGVGESITRFGIDAANQNAQIPPTIEIRPGFRFSIAVNKDIVFPGQYDDGIQRRRVR